MTIEFEISTKEQKELADLAQRRAQKQFVPGWLTITYWYVLWPGTILSLGFWYENMAPVIASFIAFSVLGYGSNYLWRRLYERGMERVAPDQPAVWTLSIDDAGLTLASQHSRHWYGWDDFRSVEETQNYVFIHALAGEFVYAPRRGFKSEEDCARFVGLAEARLRKSEAVR